MSSQHHEGESLRTDGQTTDLLKEVWGNLSACIESWGWGQMTGWSLLLGTTFIPVMGLWGANRIRPGEPLLPLCVLISVIGGTIGMPLCYPQKGYWLAGLLAGPLFGPGVFLSFWLLAGAVMNKLIFLLLVALGGAPSFVLYLSLLCWTASRRAGSENGEGRLPVPIDRSGTGLTPDP